MQQYNGDKMSSMSNINYKKEINKLTRLYKKSDNNIRIVLILLLTLGIIGFLVLIKLLFIPILVCCLVYGIYIYKNRKVKEWKM